MKPTFRKSWAGNLLVWSDLLRPPLLQGQTRTAKLKGVYNLLIIVLEVFNVKPSYRKSWAGNFLMCSDLTLGPSFKVKRGEQNLKVLITRLLLVFEACNVKLNYRISWAGNLLMSDLTFRPSFKVKRWFTGFGELSSWWIQICISSPMHRSSCDLLGWKSSNKVLLSNIIYWYALFCINLFVFFKSLLYSFY